MLPLTKPTQPPFPASALMTTAETMYSRGFMDAVRLLNPEMVKGGLVLSAQILQSIQMVIPPVDTIPSTAPTPVSTNTAATGTAAGSYAGSQNRAAPSTSMDLEKNWSPLHSSKLMKK